MTRRLVLLGMIILLGLCRSASAGPPITLSALEGGEGARRVSDGRVRWAEAGALASPTSPRPSAPPGAEREFIRDLLLDPHPGARLPLDTSLTNEAGQSVALGKFFTGRPVLLAFEYLRCKTICGVALGQLAQAAEGLGAAVVAISIDPRDAPADAAKAKARYIDTGLAADWHFLTGPEAAVRPIADAAGFRYRYDPASDQYIHSVGYVAAAAEGTISSYLPELGITTAQLRDALAAAENRQPRPAFERLLLLCFGGTPHGRYTGLIETALVLFNLAGVLGAVAVFAWTRRHRQG